MVVKKAKVKKIKKAKVSKTDSKQNKEINLLKKKLKEIAVKFLKKQKKKLPTKTYDKIKNKIINRISTTKNIKTLERLLETLTKTPINQIPSRMSDFIPSRNNIKETIIKVAKEEVDERSPDVVRKCSEAKEKFYELLEKYQNGEIASADFFDIYIIVKKCSEALSVFLPSWSQITNLYRTGKSMLQYFKSFINRNLLNRGGAITDPISSTPPPPPPDDNDDDEPQPPRPPPSSPPPPPDEDDDDDDMSPPPPATQAPIDPLETPIDISNTFLAEAPTQVNVETSTLSQALPYLATVGAASIIGASAAAYNNVYNKVYKNFRRTQQRRISQAGSLHQHTNVNKEQVRQDVGAQQVVARNFNRRHSINPEPETGFRTSPQQRAQRQNELVSRDISEGVVASDPALMRQLSDIETKDPEIDE